MNTKILLLSLLLTSCSSILLLNKDIDDISTKRDLASRVTLYSILLELEALEEQVEYDYQLEKEKIKIALNNYHSFTENNLLEIFNRILSKSTNLERTYLLLNQSGLKDALIESDNPDPQKVQTLTWWLKKQPLTSIKLKPPQNGEVTAKDLGISIVNHSTVDQKAHDSIMNTSDGHPNAFISRKKTTGELAQNGEGFYTLKGFLPLAGLSERPNIKMILNPNAVEGRDFKISWRYQPNNGEEIVEILILNKKALRVIKPNDSCDSTLQKIFK